MLATPSNSIKAILQDSDRAIASQVGRAFLVGEFGPICEFIFWSRFVRRPVFDFSAWWQYFPNRVRAKFRASQCITFALPGQHGSTGRLMAEAVHLVAHKRKGFQVRVFRITYLQTTLSNFCTLVPHQAGTHDGVLPVSFLSQGTSNVYLPSIMLSKVASGWGKQGLHDECGFRE